MKKSVKSLLAAAGLVVCMCVGCGQETIPAAATAMAADRTQEVFPVAGEAAIQWNVPTAKAENIEGEAKEGQEQAGSSMMPLKDTLQAAVTGDPYKTILEAAVPYLREKGYGLEVVLCDDYSRPNTMVATGEADVNFFQHSAYLERFNTQMGTNLVMVDRLYYEPMGLYTTSAATGEEAAPAAGTEILVPDNATAITRALFLLKELGWITLMWDADMTAVWEDVESNPHDLVFTPMEESQIPAALQEGKIGFFHRSYTVLDGIAADCRLIAEEKEASYMIPQLAYILVTAEGKEEDPGIRILSEILSSQEIREFVQMKYGNALQLFEQ